MSFSRSSSECSMGPPPGDARGGYGGRNGAGGYGPGQGRRRKPTISELQAFKTGGAAVVAQPSAEVMGAMDEQRRDQAELEDLKHAIAQQQQIAAQRQIQQQQFAQYSAFQQQQRAPGQQFPQNPSMMYAGPAAPSQHPMQTDMMMLPQQGAPMYGMEPSQPGGQHWYPGDGGSSPPQGMMGGDGAPAGQGAGAGGSRLPQRRRLRTDPTSIQRRPPFDVTASGRRRAPVADPDDYFPPMDDYGSGPRRQGRGQGRRRGQRGSPNTRHAKNSGRGRLKPATADRWPLRTDMSVVTQGVMGGGGERVAPREEDLPAYARRRPREVVYKPYTLKDYKQLKDNAPKKMGRLGPDLASPELQKKQERRKKMQKYGQRVKQMHQQHIPAPIVPRGSIRRERQLSKAERAREYAKSIRKPSRRASEGTNKQQSATNSYVTGGYGGTFGYGVGAGSRGGGYDLQTDASSKYRSAADKQLETLELQHRMDLDAVSRIRDEHGRGGERGGRR